MKIEHFWFDFHGRWFRAAYPEGANFVVAPDVKRPFIEKHAGWRVEFVDLETLVSRLGAD